MSIKRDWLGRLARRYRPSGLWLDETITDQRMTLRAGSGPDDRRSFFGREGLGQGVNSTLAQQFHQ